MEVLLDGGETIAEDILSLKRHFTLNRYYNEKYTVVWARFVIQQKSIYLACKRPCVLFLAPSSNTYFFPEILQLLLQKRQIKCYIFLNMTV